MKNKVILFLAIAILGIGSYLFFQKKNPYLNTLKRFVPDNTLLLLETNELSGYPESIVFAEIPLLSRVENQFSLLKKMGLSTEEVKDLLKGKMLYFALLPEVKADLNYITYLPLTQNDAVLVNKISKLQENISGSRIIYHTTRGYRIAEVIDSTTKSVLSFIIQNDILIFSSSSILIEESILPSENTWIKEISNVLSINNDVATTATHLNKNAISKFINKISTHKDKGASQFTQLFSDYFSGFESDKSIISAIGNSPNDIFFEGQTPKKIETLSMIPNTSSFLLHIPIDNQTNFEENLKKYFGNHKELNTLRNTVKAAFKVNYSDIYQNLESEIVFTGFDEGDEKFNGKALILRNNKLLDILKNTSVEVSKEKNANVVTVEYGGYPIKSLGIREFPSMLFGEYFAGFEECYFTEYKSNVILTNSLSAMQSYLLTLSKGDVWSNSSKNQALIKKCKPANLTLITETNKALLGFNKSLVNAWASKFAENESVLNRIQVCIFEVNQQKTSLRFFKNLSLSQPSKKYSNKWLKLSSIKIDSAAKPFYIINPSTKKQEVFVQDDDNKIHYLKGGKTVWSYQLGGKLVGEIKNVKILPTAQQQLLLACPTKIYILTKNEGGFEVHPITNNTGTRISDFILFDKETDRKFNTTLFTANAASFKIDKSSLSLKLHYKPVSGLQYILPISTVILRGVEYAILLDKKGKLTLQDADGNIANGFPLALNRTFNGPAILEGSGEKISIKALSENGELFSVSLSGKIMEKKQLLRPSIEIKFFLCADQRNADWVIMKTDGKDVVVLDKTEREIFTIKEETYGVKRLKYYNLGIGGKYFALTNSYTNYRFFDENGSYVGGMPLVSTSYPVLTYSESYQKLIIDITTPTAFENWSVKLR
ncbi:hypothetical protein VB264_13680 [Arcicella aquatica]|uniref:Outer membrane protein assembly factor BamB n=1 Tax=Arcicella aquatica TaxID=217141 RepID=A0ABU5QP48_9BACT|nr:hypothetical protein [Arcicella aquatica]MEA5258842.1 hypothetical protein [Arcicella aquatica]